jgi:hypothetical protein
MIFVRDTSTNPSSLFNLIFNAKSRVSVDPSGVRGSGSSELLGVWSFKTLGCLGKIERKRKTTEGRTYFPVSQCYNKH